MKALLGFFLLSVLLTSGYCLLCETCAGIGTSCSGTQEKCPAGLDGCITAVTEVSVGGSKMNNIMKSCFSSKSCKDLKPGSIASFAGTGGSVVSVECSKAPASSGSIFLALSSLLFLKLLW